VGSAPRLFCIPATQAPVVAVLRRGPSRWSHVGRWELDPPAYVPGSWLHGTIYPQRCDLSPDGRWLSYFAMGHRRTDWSAGNTYIAVSELPRLTAVAAWGTDGTWTQGAAFVPDTSVWSVGEADEGDASQLRSHFGLALRAASSYAVERERGWRETPGTPPRDQDDVWDQRRGDAIELYKRRPSDADGPTLVVSGQYAAFRSGAPGPISYRVVSEGAATSLDDVQWADWAGDGRLLVATSAGSLQIRDGASTLWEYDVGALSRSV
jgi:hypothetical protein